jgi:hypothetical protein
MFRRASGRAKIVETLCVIALQNNHNNQNLRDQVRTANTWLAITLADLAARLTDRPLGPVGAITQKILDR